MKLVDPSAFESFQAAVDGRPAARSEGLPRARLLRSAVGDDGDADAGVRHLRHAILSIGAVFGAMNTMYAAVAYRTREIGTLRALGFSRVRIVAAFLVESVALALVGGVIGCILALPVHGIVYRRDEHDQLQRAGVQVPDHAGAARRRPGLFRGDGGRRRPAPGVTRGPDSCRPRAARDLIRAAKHSCRS